MGVYTNATVSDSAGNLVTGATVNVIRNRITVRGNWTRLPQVGQKYNIRGPNGPEINNAPCTDVNPGEALFSNS